MAIDEKERYKRIYEREAARKKAEEAAKREAEEAKEEKGKKAKKSAYKAGFVGLAAAAAITGGAFASRYSNVNNNEDSIETSVDDNNEVLDTDDEGRITYDDVKALKTSRESLIKTIDEKLQKVDHNYHYTPEGKSWKDSTLDEEDKLNAQKDYFNQEIAILDAVLAAEAIDDDKYLSDENSEVIDDFMEIIEEGNEVEVQVRRSDVEESRENTIYTVKSFMEAGEGVSVSYDKLAAIYETPQVYFLFADEAALVDDVQNGSDSYRLYIEEQHENPEDTLKFGEDIDHFDNAGDAISGQWGTVVSTKVKEVVKVKQATPTPETPVVTPAPEKPVVPPVTPDTPPVIEDEEPTPTPDPIPDPDPTPDPKPTPGKEKGEDEKKPVPNAEDEQEQPTPGETVDDEQGQAKPEEMSATEETQGDVDDTQGQTKGGKESASEETMGDDTSSMPKPQAETAAEEETMGDVTAADVDAVFDDVFGEDAGDVTFADDAIDWEQGQVAEEETLGD